MGSAAPRFPTDRRTFLSNSWIRVAAALIFYYLYIVYLPFFT